METLLVHGFVREIEKLLTNHNIIPLDIYHICFDFYFTTKFIFYLSGLNGKDNTDIMCVANIDTKKRWKVSIHELTDNKMITGDDSQETDKWSMDSPAITFARNITLPPSILLKSDNKFKFNNIIFRCGGQNRNTERTDYCAALILDSHEFQKQENEKITVYNWKLPLLPKKIFSNFGLYSHKKHELFSIGGRIEGDNDEYSNNIFKLSFENDAYLQQKQWKWTTMDTKLPTSRECVSAAMIDNETKLIIIGGGIAPLKNTNKVELFDFHKNVWIKDIKNREIEAIDCGIYHDEISKMVYVGGGYSSSKYSATHCTECYNLEKNIWSSLPDTVLGHDMNPLIWTEDNNLLNIMSISANGIEQIDVRESKKWKVINNDLSDLFNTTFDCIDVSLSRFVGN